MVEGNEVRQAGLCNDFSVKADKDDVLLLDVSDLRNSPFTSTSEKALAYCLTSDKLYTEDEEALKEPAGWLHGSCN